MHQKKTIVHLHLFSIIFSESFLARQPTGRNHSSTCSLIRCIMTPHSHQGNKSIYKCIQCIQFLSRTGLKILHFPLWSYCRIEAPQWHNHSKTSSHRRATLILEQRGFGGAAKTGHGKNKPKWSKRRLDTAGLLNPSLHGR